MMFNRFFLLLLGSMLLSKETLAQTCNTFYDVQAGETCSSIATKFTTSVELLTYLNRGLTCPFPSGRLCVPYSPGGPIIQPAPVTTAPSKCVFTYVSKTSDTCQSIANLFNAALIVISALNQDINCANPIPAGTNVCVPSATPSGIVPSTSTCTYTYTVKAGDTCSAIATSFGITLTYLFFLNSASGLDCSRLTAGQQICAPTASPTPVVNTCPFVYTVKAGETCDSISKQYSVSLSIFLNLNPTIACNSLAIGQRVCVALNPSSTSTLTCPCQYTIKSGDTCFALAQAYQITLDSFLSLNGNTLNCNNLQPGQAVCVPSPKLCNRYYVIRSGDTCYAVALTYGMVLEKFLSINSGINCANLQIGSTVCIA